MATRKSTARKSSGRKRSGSEAGSEVREEMHKLKQGKRKNPKQAIAIGLSKARRKGKAVSSPKKGKTSAATRTRAARDQAAGRKRVAKKTARKSSR